MASNKKRTASVICKALLFSSIHQSGLNMEKMSFIYVFYLIFSISFSFLLGQQLVDMLPVNQD